MYAQGGLRMYRVQQGEGGMKIRLLAYVLWEQLLNLSYK